MIRWIQNQRWLPEIILASVFLTAGSIFDFIYQGLFAGLVAVCLAISALFIRNFSYVSVALNLIAATLVVGFGVRPIVTGVISTLLIFFAAAFTKRFWSLLILAANLIAQLAFTYDSCFDNNGYSSFFGIAISSASDRTIAFVVGSVIDLSVAAIAWLLGTWLVTYRNERRLQRERSSVDDKQIRLAIDLAEQNERIGIARDLNLVTTQHLSSVLALVEGAKYASRVDADVATRTLDRLEGLLREMHTEMRQLQDSLSRSVSVAPAPPNIYDLESLAIQYRELGYNCTISHQGEVIQLLDSAELAIYRIVFDALDNVRQHTPIGTSVSIDFSWQNSGLQVLVKDNGTETAMRQNDEGSVGQYNVNDDIESLTAQYSGIGLTAMQERASLLGGTVEAKSVPGVGFTINAIFPSLAEVTKG